MCRFISFAPPTRVHFESRISPCFFSSLYIVDRSAFSYRSNSTPELHVYLLDAPPEVCVFEWLDHRADSEMEAVLSREDVSPTDGSPLRDLSILGSGTSYLFQGGCSISFSPPTPFDFESRLCPVFFVSLYSRQERFFTPYPVHPRISPLGVGETT